MASKQPPQAHSIPPPPAQSTQNAAQGGRMMQVKVLYNLDDETKSRCLARLPQPIPIQTASLDPSTEVGVVDLRTCLQSVVSASPELTAKPEQDYTVYAYDYSEYDTPQVGQGRLSRILSSGPSPASYAESSPSMVTGAVTRGGLGLFSANGVKETLQVKLRLVPAPAAVQSESRPQTGTGTDAAQTPNPNWSSPSWTSAHHQNLTVPPPANQGWTAPLPPASAPHSMATSPQLRPTSAAWGNSSPVRHEAQSHLPRNQPSGYVPIAPNPASRPATPQPAVRQPRSKPTSRNSSSRAANIKKRAQSSAVQDQSATSEPPNKKRANVEKTNWEGPSTLEPGNDSLRVAASTAASIRGHGPSNINPAISGLSAAEAPGRPPTPQPSRRNAPALDRTATGMAHDAMTHKSFLHHTSSLNESDPQTDSADIPHSPEMKVESEVSSPIDITSSPPLLRNASPFPSSPPLPRFASHPDSGFASGGATEEALFDDEDELRMGYESQPLVRPAYVAHGITEPESDLIITEEIPGDPSLLPQKVMLQPKARRPPQDPSKISQIPLAVSNTRMSPPLSQPPIESGRTSFQSGRDNHSQAQRRPSATRSHANSPLPLEEVEALTSKANGGSGMKRKRTIQSRLKNEIAAGRMPPFCKNCGEIDTPTWRKCFIKNQAGSPPDTKELESQGEIFTWEIIEQDKNGQTTAYRLIRRSVHKDDSDFEEHQLCNPCGIWLFKFKAMRPPEKWAKNKGNGQDSGSKRKSQSKAKKNAQPTESQAGDTQYDSSMPPPDFDQSGRRLSAAKSQEPFSQPSSGRSDKSQSKTTGRAETTVTSGIPQGQPAQQNGSGNKFTSRAADQRNTNSGSQSMPIDLDPENTPTTARRLLFPSPRRPGEVKSLEHPDTLQTANPERPLRRSPRKKKGTLDASDKENAPQAADSDDELFTADQTVGSPSQMRQTRQGVAPQTPKKSSVAESDPLRTPTRSTRSSARKSASQRGVLSSATNRWLRGRHESPSRSGNVTGTEELTPFSKGVAQFLSDYNGPNASSSSPIRGNGENIPSAGMGNDGNLFDIFTNDAGYDFADHDPLADPDYQPPGDGNTMRTSANTPAEDVFTLPPPSHRSNAPGDSNPFDANNYGNNNGNLFNFFDANGNAMDLPNEPGSDFWPMEPLMDGELEALLKEAGDDAYHPGTGANIDFDAAFPGLDQGPQNDGQAGMNTGDQSQKVIDPAMTGIGGAMDMSGAFENNDGIQGLEQNASVGDIGNNQNGGGSGLDQNDQDQQQQG